MEINEEVLARLVERAVRDIARERAASAVQTESAPKEHVYLDAFEVKDSPLIEGCKPCSQHYWAQRRQHG